jgi:hypothetical protein
MFSRPFFKASKASNPVGGKLFAEDKSVDTTVLASFTLIVML